MHIDIAIAHLSGLISYFQRYRETGFEEALVEAKTLASSMGIEPKFREKRPIC